MSPEELILPDIKLWPDQENAILFATGRTNCGLGMPMGAGKTLVAAVLIASSRAHVVLIVSTRRILSDDAIWPAHLRMLKNGYDVVHLIGNSRVRSDLYDHDPERPTVYTITFGSLWREPLASKLLAHPPKMVLIDESQHIKSPSSKVSRFAARLGRRVWYRIAITGTVLAHSPLDAWSQCRFLDPSLFGTSFGAHRSEYAVMGGYEGKQVLSGKNGIPWLHQDRFAHRLSAHWFICEAPKLPFDVEPVYRKFQLGSESRRVYDELEREYVANVRLETVTAPLAVTRTIRILQAVSGFARTDRMPGGTGGCLVDLDGGRMAALVDILQEVDYKERVVVFVGQFIFDLDRVREAARIADRPYYEISGRANDLDTWRSSQGGTILAVSMKSASEGIDLTSSRFGIFYSHQYSMYRYDQARARLVRPPTKSTEKTKPRRLFYLLSENTIEEAILLGIKEKGDVADRIYRSAMDRQKKKATVTP